MNVAVAATEQKLPEVKREWVKPDFRDFDTPMEVTAYAARSLCRARTGIPAGRRGSRSRLARTALPRSFR